MTKRKDRMELQGRQPLEDLRHHQLIVIARNLKGKSALETIEIPLMSKDKLCLFIRGKGGVPEEYR
jgi:hypothetical protein